MSKGVYILLIRLDSDKSINIGKLGNISFKKGYYCYVGSAMNNLEKRIARHKRNKKKIHWHIDYFLKYGRISFIIKFKTSRRIECMLSRNINKIADGSVKGFGCSDCRCSSHLYYFKKNPALLLNKIFINVKNRRPKGRGVFLSMLRNCWLSLD